MRTAEGAVYEGQWVGDRQHGQGTITYPSGIVWTGAWENGVKAEEQPVPAAEGGAAPAAPADGKPDEGSGPAVGA